MGLRVFLRPAGAFLSTVQPRKVRTAFVPVALGVTVRLFFRTDFQVELSSVPACHQILPNFFF